MDICYSCYGAKFLIENHNTITFSFQSVPSEARSQLLIVDISNLLLCVAQLLPTVCDNAKELIGFSLNTCSKIIRDVHTKCQELLNCFLLRGAPLDTIYKVCIKNVIFFLTI